MTDNFDAQLFKAKKPPDYYVGIGASAGGLEAIEAFFGQMPPTNNLAFIVIQHLSPHFKSLMTELLSKRTQMPVYKIEDGMVVEANCIYMIPPRKNLILFHGKLLLKEQDHSRGVNLPIDVFFQSLAEDQGEKSIAIILSGTGSDGTRGIRKIKELGGMIMVQTEESAKFDGMPRSAINTGLVDFVLAAEQMSVQLLSFTQRPYAQKASFKDKLISDDNSITRVFALLREHHKIDFTYYKPSTILRRIERRMTVNQIHELKDYVLFMETYHKEISALYRELLIGVTSFFRDPEVFGLVRDKILPEIFNRVTDREIRLWTTACSTGEEAYTLAILCQETMQALGKNVEVKIFATDVDRNALTLAGNGIYPESIAADLAPDLLAKYFQRHDDNYHVVRKLREMVVFAQHNVIKDPPFTNIDFLSCRNLLIYLQPVLQKKALEFFNFSLNSQGVLLLGTSETLGELSDYFDTIDAKWKLYYAKGKRKLAGFARDTVIPYDAINQRSYAQLSNRLPNEDERFLERFIQLFGDNPEQLLAIVLTEKAELVYTLCDKEKFLVTPLGRSSYDVNKMIIKELAIPLATGLQKAFKTRQEVRYSSICLKKDNGSQTVQMRIKPLPEKKGQNSYAGVFVEKTNPNTSSPPAGESSLEQYDVSKETEQRLQDLEQELQFTKENLQATIEELETSNEELQATNEELLASNEELQSTNEELQSVNEELFTVNSEYQQKIIELTVLNNDVENLLLSTEIATVFIDENLEVRKFTPKINQIFKIIDSDLGRPLTHLANYLLDVDPVKISQAVIDSKKTIEKEISTADGRQYLMNVLPYKIGKNIYSGVVMTFTDITTVKETQSALELSQERFNLAQRAADFGVWDWNIDADQLYWSDTIELLFGLKKGLFNQTYSGFLACVHPNDRQSVQEAAKNALNNHKPYYVEHRVLCPDERNTRWFSETGKVYYNQNDKPVRMLGVVQDITDKHKAIAEKNQAIEQKKQAEQDLLLADFAFESQQATSITDAGGNILRVNQAFTELCGYSKEELRGKNHRILQSGQQNELFYQKMWQSLVENGYWEGQVWNKHKNGTLYLEHSRIIAVRNEQNEVVYYVGYFQAIQPPEENSDFNNTTVLS
jgi:two-component system CheB/CheR fusion protein